MYIVETKFVYFRINPCNSRLKRFFLLSLNHTKNILQTATTRLKKIQEGKDLESIEEAQKIFSKDSNDCFVWSSIISGIIENPNYMNINERLEYHFDSTVMKYY